MSYWYRLFYSSPLVSYKCMLYMYKCILCNSVLRLHYSILILPFTSLMPGFWIEGQPRGNRESRVTPRFKNRASVSSLSASLWTVQIHQPCMFVTLLLTAAAFLIIFVAVRGYSQVNVHRDFSSIYIHSQLLLSFVAVTVAAEFVATVLWSAVCMLYLWFSTFLRLC